jgi:hypothetical protein
VYICKGSYQIIRDNLKARGWVENKDYHSPCFDLKWTCKSVEAYNTLLTDNQVII